MRLQPPKGDRLIADPMGAICVSLIFLDLIVFLEACPQKIQSAPPTDGKVNLYVSPKEGNTYIYVTMHILTQFFESVHSRARVQVL